MIGHVLLIDHMGSDLTIANVARVSLGRSVEKLGESEERLIAYLLKHKHTSPLRHCFVTFHITAPIFVLRQWAKHTIGCAWNEISYRYVQHDAERAPVWTPDAWRESAPGVKQGSGGELKSEIAAEVHGAYQAAINDSIRAYTELLARGVCREQARAVLPQGVQTEVIWTASLQAILHFLDLRLAPDAQEEIRGYAREVRGLVAPLFPVVLRAWEALKNEA